MITIDKAAAAIGRLFSDRIWRENGVANYASFGILVFLTSFFWAPTRDFMHVVYGLSFFAPMLLVLLLRKPNFDQYGGWFTCLALLYAGYASISTLWSDAPRIEFFAQHFLFLAVWLAGTAWLAARQRVDIENVYRILTLVSAVCGLVLMVVFYWEKPLSTRLGILGYGVARNSNTLGYMFGATSLISYVAWLTSKGQRQNWCSLGILSLNVMPFLAAQSRGAFLGFIISIAFAFFGISKARYKLALHAFLLACVAGIIAFEWDFVIKTVSSRLSEPFYRDLVWPVVLERGYNDHALFGSGLVKTSRIYVPASELPPFNHAHSSYLDAFYRTGLVGLVLMLAHMLFVFRHWSFNPRILPLFLWLTLSCIMSLFDHPGFFCHLEPLWFAYWIPAGLIGALVMAEKQKYPPA